MQYVYFIADVLVTTINVRVVVIDPSHTSVQVTYERTALKPKVNDQVRAMGAQDRKCGPDWRDAIAAYLTAQEKR